MVEPFQEHLHARLADFFLVNAHRRERRVHQNSLITIVETDQADLVRHFDSLPPQKQPQTIGRFVVAGNDCRGAWRSGKNSLRALLAKIDETLGVSWNDCPRPQLIFAHRLTITVESPLNPRERNVSCKIDQTMSLLNQIPCGLERSAEVIESYLIVGLLSIHAHHIVTEGYKRHLNGLDSAKKVWINRPCQNDTVNQAMLLKNRRQVNFLRGHPRRIVKHGKQHVMFQAAGVRFDTLQNARVKGMEKVSVAQEKANDFGASLQDSPGLGVGAETEATDGFVHKCASLPAHLRARIEDARNRANAHAGSPRHISNGGLLWNCFQA